jgi:hypothetical protein
MLSSKIEEENDKMALQLVFHEATLKLNLDQGVVVTVHSEENVVMASLIISLITTWSSGRLWCGNAVKTAW